MKTKFGTVVLVPSHKDGFFTKQSKLIDWDISNIIDQYKETQIQGDFLIDINSFHEHPAKFAILRFNETDGWTEYGDHRMIMKRLEEMNGIIRLRLGEMLSVIIRGYHVRIWNYLDKNGNTLDTNVSETGVRVPNDVSFILHRAGIKRQQFEIIQQPESYPAIKDYPIGIIAFREESWSPSQALNVLKKDHPLVNDFEFNQVDLSPPPPKTEGRKTPKAERRSTKPSLKTGT